jgi:hypothetical protein
LPDPKRGALSGLPDDNRREGDVPARPAVQRVDEEISLSRGAGEGRGEGD